MAIDVAFFNGRAIQVESKRIVRLLLAGQPMRCMAEISHVNSAAMLQRREVYTL